MIKLISVSVFSFAVILISVYGIQYIDDVQSAFDINPSRIIIATAYFLLMIVGAIASERYKYFAANSGAGRNFFAGISYSYLYRSLLVSPIVFGAVVTYIGRDSSLVMSAIFSFQNGFFWENIFNAANRASSRPSTSEVKPLADDNANAH